MAGKILGLGHFLGYLHMVPRIGLAAKAFKLTEAAPKYKLLGTF